MDDEKIKQWCCQIQPKLEEILRDFGELLSQKYNISGVSVVEFTLIETLEFSRNMLVNSEQTEFMQLEQTRLELPPGCYNQCWQVGNSMRCAIICPR